MTRPTDAFTLLELLVVIAIIGILAAIGIGSYEGFNNRAANAAQLVSAQLLQIRVDAMGRTAATRVRLDQGKLVVQRASSCNSPDTEWQAASSLNLSPPDRVAFASSSPTIPWIVCFNARGLADKTTTLSISDNRNRVRTISIYLSGAVEVS
ncbi:prepilin-type N-terminal cleavage/methylation domain-containing protein [uncultured Deinococcus sp.]|uniref:prepilin-type N-terminal cleavage/methylation domain-containing protein n=1 Tax=uncultured Deinococcus sp. TaxID=158789 RepID=UPI0025859E34|nr:prepilin-type N-terminal cleavage/methylation domain-containing protein [uncultured Deinococcus sp.]